MPESLYKMRGLFVSAASESDLFVASPEDNGSTAPTCRITPQRHDQSDELGISLSTLSPHQVDQQAGTLRFSSPFSPDKLLFLCVIASTACLKAPNLPHASGVLAST